MKTDTRTVISCCRITAAVCLLAVLLSFKMGIAVKYFAFLLCTAIAGLNTESIRLPHWRYTSYCASLTLLLTVVISYVLPSSDEAFELTPMFILSAVVFAPVFEELFFRGALMGHSPNFVSCIIASAIFGAFHGVDFIQTFLLGLALSYFYMSSGSVAVPILCHMANNLLAVLCMKADVRIPVLMLSLIIAVIQKRR